jgi:hypothetical protein
MTAAPDRSTCRQFSTECWLSRAFERYSAWGPQADRHDKSLIHVTLEGLASAPFYRPFNHLSLTGLGL